MYKFPDLDKNVVIITGGSSGIGKATALKLSEQGCKVCIFDIKEEGGNVICDEIKAKNGECIFFKCDVADYSQVEKNMQKVIDIFGCIDTLVVNAAKTSKIYFDNLNLEKWQELININLTGAFICSKIALKHMIKVKKGRIIMISSASAFTGGGGRCDYAASKAGMIGLARSLSKEFSPRGIIINSIAPRSIKTELFDKLYSNKASEKIKKKIPLGRLGTPEEVANVVLFLSSNLSSYINGEIIFVDGGRTFIN